MKELSIKCLHEVGSAVYLISVVFYDISKEVLEKLGFTSDGCVIKDLDTSNRQSNHVANYGIYDMRLNSSQYEITRCFLVVFMWTICFLALRILIGAFISLFSMV